MKIAFTSCMDAERVPEQPVWDRIEARDPDALMLLGDNIYMDWGLRSLAETPRWRKRWDDTRSDPAGRAEVLVAFCEDMHRRYKLQWEVAAFKRLITWFVVEKRRADALYVIRDEHDMAWNNARGAGDERDTKWVPAEIATASTRLFEQFRAVLADPRRWASSYPAIDEALPPAPAPRTRLGPFTVLLQDQRSHRSALLIGGTLNPQRRLLSNDARDDMLTEVHHSQRPLLIIGSSPLRHDYRFSEQGWWTSTAVYPEYDALIAAAKQSGRAVLYLGGDIHRLAYGGPVEAGSSVVQMLASGAAVGRLLFKKFPASFAWLDVADNGGSGTIVIQGMEDAKPPLSFPELKYAGYQWDGQPTAGEAPIEIQLPALATLAVLTMRRREADSLNASPRVEPQQLDTLYGDTLANDGGFQRYAAEAVTVTQAPGATQITLDRGGRVDALIEAAFARAQTDGRSAVVFFIHGFNKSFSESLDQACELRERFNVEPVLFSWPAGEEGGWLKTLLEAGEAARRCGQQDEALRAALQTFGEVAEQTGFAATIVARSLGAFALQKALSGSRQKDQMPGKLSSVKRVLLSAPAVKAASQTKWLERLGNKLVVTINANDRTLRHGDLLGRNVPSDHDRAPDGQYLEWTSVGDLHDYLLTSIGTAGDALNKKLVTGESFDAADLRAARVLRL